MMDEVIGRQHEPDELSMSSSSFSSSTDAAQRRLRQMTVSGNKRGSNGVFDLWNFDQSSSSDVGENFIMNNHSGEDGNSGSSAGSIASGNNGAASSVFLQDVDPQERRFILENHEKFVQEQKATLSLKGYSVNCDDTHSEDELILEEEEGKVLEIEQMSRVVGVDHCNEESMLITHRNSEDTNSTTSGSSINNDGIIITSKKVRFKKSGDDSDSIGNDSGNRVVVSFVRTSNNSITGSRSTSNCDAITTTDTSNMKQLLLSSIEPHILRLSIYEKYLCLSTAFFNIHDSTISLRNLFLSSQVQDIIQYHRVWVPIPTPINGKYFPYLANCIKNVGYDECLKMFHDLFLTYPDSITEYSNLKIFPTSRGVKVIAKIMFIGQAMKTVRQQTFPSLSEIPDNLSMDGYVTIFFDHNNRIYEIWNDSIIPLNYNSIMSSSSGDNSNSSAIAMDHRETDEVMGTVSHGNTTPFGTTLVDISAIPDPSTTTTSSSSSLQSIPVLSPSSSIS